MTCFVSFFRRLFGTSISAKEDHLGGAVDLSDVAYCLGLLAQESD
jgi:hypothetical protein